MLKNNDFNLFIQLTISSWTYVQVTWFCLIIYFLANYDVCQIDKYDFSLALGSTIRLAI